LLGVRMRWAIVAVVVVVAATLALVIRPPIKRPALAHDLIAMEREIDFRAVSVPTGQQFRLSDLPKSIQERFEDQSTQDQRHMDRMVVLLERYGWPTEKMVGREGVRAAILVVERAPDIAFKDRAVSLMQQVGADDNPEYAQLVDTVAVFKGEPQTYGTQWTCSADSGDDAMHVRLTTPLKDPDHLVALRRSVGLPPYDKFARAFCASPGDGPRIIKRGIDR
jgi:hypothetical protein